jgi:RNA polymerase sigma-70 factor (ECF subfamily)
LLQGPPHRSDSGRGETEGREADPGWRLVGRAQSGDSLAFAELYERHVDTVFRFLYYRTNRDKSLTEDLTSETFLRALRGIGGVTDQGRDIGAWFVTIARNLLYDHAKSARQRLEIVMDELPDAPFADSEPEAAAMAHDASEAVLGAVAELKDEQRECLTLRFVQGLSLAETAAAMGKNENAIKALQHRAVKRLAAVLEKRSPGMSTAPLPHNVTLRSSQSLGNTTRSGGTPPDRDRPRESREGA